MSYPGFFKILLLKYDSNNYLYSLKSWINRPINEAVFAIAAAADKG